jgi:hypothetical protein
MSDEIKLHHDLRLDYLRRAKVCFKACENIPTPALEAGLVEKVVGWARECDGKTVCPVCYNSNDHLNSCVVGKIIKLLEETK